ncbi:DUF4232 domain-containing protein [Streptomyces sp. NPDC093600]|uniref:DUF4232 domain-containing protein n=1 Tax=Streptomyces sp. NPDC093600 TaxID=3366047 RepID=UPI0037FFEFED
MRTFRNRTTVLAAAATAVLTLTVTACGGDGSGVRSAGSAADSSAPAPASSAPAAESAESASPSTGTPGSTGTGTGTGKNAGATRGAGTGKAATSPTAASTPVCTPKSIAISAARQDGPPYTHIVLTAKNTSRHSCRLTGFPEIQFLESHRENVPAVAKSRPAAPVVLAAGAPAYARVKLSDGGVDEHTEPVTDFAVTLRGSDEVIAVRAPGEGGIAVDPAKWATGYWTPQLRNGADDF